jgi:beta-N-acetylhexosaminidase
MGRNAFIIALVLFINMNLYSEPINFYSDIPDEELIRLIIPNMTNQELLGQVLMFSYDGDVVSNENLYWVRDNNLGAIKIFGWNARNLYNLTLTIATLQKHAQNHRFKIPLLVATDQEGGWVRHVRGNTSITPGNLSLGASGTIYDSYITGKIIGEELKLLGINMNFAPTVDVYRNTGATVIGPRAFSSDPVLTANLAVAYYKGLESQGIIATAKHFPGHGNTNKDSHGILPIIYDSLEDLYRNDLVPYELLIKEDLPAVMMGHLSFPKITGKTEAASLSYDFVTKLLKDEMGFKGITITDDLFMHGARVKGLSYAQECKLALLAGNDVILVSQTKEQHKVIWNTLLQNMDENENLKLRIIDAATRILRVKLKYLKGDNAVPLYPSKENIEKLNKEDTQYFIQSQAARSIHVLKNDQIPINKESKILFLGNNWSFFNIGKTFFNNSGYYYINSTDDINKLEHVIINYNYVIYGLFNLKTSSYLALLEKHRNKLIVMSYLTPVYLKRFPWIQSSILAFSNTNESILASFSVLTGDIKARGNMPLNFDIMED